MKKKVFVESGDIAQIQADVLITAINSQGIWSGGIDNVIYQVAGNFFHSYALKKMPLKDGQTILALGKGYKHSGLFSNVIFVVDDLKKPLHEIIYAGLKTCSDAGFKTVLIPTIRMGVMLGVVEKNKHSTITRLHQGVWNFFAMNKDHNLEKITFVVYNDTDTELLLKQLIYESVA